MGQMVTVSETHGVAATTAVELISVEADSVNPMIVHSIRIGQNTEAGDAQAEMLQIVLARFTGTLHGQVGGVVANENNHELGMPTPGVVGYVGSETLSTVRTTVIDDGFNVQAGYLYLPTPEERILIAPGAGFVAALPTGPVDPITFHCSMTVEELLVA